MYTKINKRLLALASIGFLTIATAAFALSVPPSATFSARQNTTQQLNYFRFTLNYNDPNISTGVKFGRLPSAAFISAIKCHVSTAFNGVTTNVVILGSSQGGSEFFGASDLTEVSAQYQNLTSAAGLGLFATSGGEVDLWARYQSTGTAPTAGAVTCVLEYEPNNDK